MQVTRLTLNEVQSYLALELTIPSEKRNSSWNYLTPNSTMKNDLKKGLSHIEGNNLKR